jgi:hypothetical protein
VGADASASGVYSAYVSEGDGDHVVRYQFVLRYRRYSLMPRAASVLAMERRSVHAFPARIFRIVPSSIHESRATDLTLRSPIAARKFDAN